LSLEHFKRGIAGKGILSSAIGVSFVSAVLLAPRVVERKYNRVRLDPAYTASSDTDDFHQSLLIADLHADSLLWGRDLLQESKTGHIDVPRLQQANVSLQVFSVVSTIPRNLNIERNTTSSDMVKLLAIVDRWPPRTWNSPKARALYQAQRLRDFASRSGGQLVLLRTSADLRQLVANQAAHRIGALLATEGAQPLEGRIENLDELYAAGFRMMSPAHFTDTDIGGSASGERKNGLTDVGRSWVRAMEAKSMTIDLAHASPETLRDVTTLATKPVVVSHTGAKGVCNNNRNLSDEALRSVARTGGVVGVGYWETAVCGGDADAVVRSIQYVAGVIGVEHVGLGSDFDGATTTPFDVTGLRLITHSLREAHFSEHDIALIMGGNVVRVLAQNLPRR